MRHVGISWHDYIKGQFREGFVAQHVIEQPTMPSKLDTVGKAAKRSLPAGKVSTAPKIKRRMSAPEPFLFSRERKDSAQFLLPHEHYFRGKGSQES
jgi:hypothetical protein